MLTIDYSQFLSSTGDWSGSAFIPPDHYKDYLPIVSGVSSLSKDEPVITFSNLPANLKITPILNDPDYGYNPPFDKVFIDVSYDVDFIYLKNESGVWIAEESTGPWMAAYTSGGYWAFGTATYESPGVNYTGSGNADSSILDIVWIPVDSGDNDSTPPEPFSESVFYAPSYPDDYVIVYPDEPSINYEVIDDSTIRILTDIDDLIPPLRKLYINFSGITP